MQKASRIGFVTWLVLSTVFLTVLVGSASPAHAANAGTPFGSIDWLAPGGDGIDVSGWVIDPDTSRFTDVHVYAGATLLGVANADDDRPDVGRAFPGSGDGHGYSLHYALLAGVHDICVYGINIGRGDHVQLGCRRIAIAAPWGNVDGVSQGPDGFRVTGWAADPDTTEAIDVIVELAGSGRYTVRADRSRPDVGRLFGWQGSEHGFEAVIPVPRGEGSFGLCVYAIGRGQGPAFTSLGCRAVAVTASPIGAIDLIGVGTGTVRVAGWAVDPDTTGSIEIGISVENVGVSWFPAKANRPDIVSAVPGYGTEHGFSVEVVAPAGARRLCVAFRNVGAGSDRPMGCTVIDSVPGGSGSGRRVVYSNLGQHVWIIGSDGFVVRSYEVSGRYLDPSPGQYSVLSHLRWTSAGHDDISMEYFVEFIDFEKGYGFHTIPVFADGTPLQGEDELGQFRSAGCVRQRRADAIFLYNWSDIGDPVHVI